MSQATKRKYVSAEVLHDFSIPDETKGETVVKCLAGRGNNLHEVEQADGTRYLVSMPTKFRKNIWVKRGDFMVVAPIEEGDKVKAEIARVLYKDQIKHLKQEKAWPFKEEEKEVEEKIKELSVKDDGDEYGSSDDDNDDDLFVNTNRRVVEIEEDETTSEEEETDSEEEEEEESK